MRKASMARYAFVLLALSMLAASGADNPAPEKGSVWDTAASWVTAIGTCAMAYIILMQLSPIKRQAMKAEQQHALAHALAVQSQQLAQIEFEDSLNREYRGLVKLLPNGAFSKHGLPENVIADSLRSFYCYFDLCNQQILMKERIRPGTFEEWKLGIFGNLERKAFAGAWKLIRDETGDFEELNTLLREASGTVNGSLF